MRKYGWLFLLIAAFAAIGFLVMWRSKVPPAPVQATEAQTGGPSERTVIDISSTRPTSKASAPLPEVDEVRIATIYTELEQRARTGDAGAACRLASELTRCRIIAQWDEGATARRADELAKSSREGDVGKLADALAEAHEYNLGVRERCGGLTREQYRQLPRLTYLAASAGHVPSMLDFASGAGFYPEDLLGDPELYTTYRTQAWAMFLRAFEAGEPRAVSEWALALQSPNQLMAGVMPDEWRRPGLARALLETLRGQLPNGGSHLILQPSLGEESRPTDEEWTEAENLFHQRFERSPAMLKLLSEPPPPPQAMKLQLATNHCTPSG